MGLDKKFQKLLRLGLADKKRLQRYETVMSDTKHNINVAEYRPIILSVLDKLIANTIDDPMIYQKTQQNLLKKNGYIKEEKKMKKTKIPPTQRTDMMQPNPSSCDVSDSGKYNEEKQMSSEFISLIKSLSNKLLTENLNRGTALRKNASGSPRSGTNSPVHNPRSTSPAANRTMQNKARDTDIKAQNDSAKRYRNLKLKQQADQKNKYKEQQAQDKLKSSV